MGDWPAWKEKLFSCGAFWYRMGPFFIDGLSWSRYYTRARIYLIISLFFFFPVLFLLLFLDASFIDRCVAEKDCLPALRLCITNTCIHMHRDLIFWVGFFYSSDSLAASFCSETERGPWWMAFAQLDPLLHHRCPTLDSCRVTGSCILPTWNSPFFITWWWLVDYVDL